MRYSFAYTGNKAFCKICTLHFFQKVLYLFYIQNVDEDSTIAMFLTERAAFAGSSLELALGRPPRSDFNTVRLSALRRMKWFGSSPGQQGWNRVYYVP